MRRYGLEVDANGARSVQQSAARQVEIVALILDRNADVKRDEDAFAATSGSKDIVDLFLERKIVDMYGPHGMKILRKILDLGYRPEIAKMLRKAGACQDVIKDEL